MLRFVEWFRNPSGKISCHEKPAEPTGLELATADSKARVEALLDWKSNVSELIKLVGLESTNHFLKAFVNIFALKNAWIRKNGDLIEIEDSGCMWDTSLEYWQKKFIVSYILSKLDMNVDFQDQVSELLERVPHSELLAFGVGEDIDVPTFDDFNSIMSEKIGVQILSS